MSWHRWLTIDIPINITVYKYLGYLFRVTICNYNIMRSYIYGSSFNSLPYYMVHEWTSFFYLRYGLMYHRGVIESCGNLIPHHMSRIIHTVCVSIVYNDHVQLSVKKWNIDLMLTLCCLSGLVIVMIS